MKMFLRFPGGRLKAVTLSYDDGVRDDLPLAAIIDRYGIKCTFNLNSDYMMNHEKATPDDYRRLIANGHEVAVHGARHIAPGIGLPAVVIDDIIRCRRVLEETFGGIIRGMAYPDSGVVRMHNGNTYENIRSYMQNLGIAYARSLSGDNDGFMIPTDFYAWVPTAHHANPHLMEWVDKFVSIREEELRYGNRYPRLFYLWGHSYEFSNNHNWEIMEQFCEKIGGKEDTWYATNIEICDYVKAFGSLLTSVDGKTVYNPTLLTLWMDVDGVSYHVDPGQTVRFA